MTDLERARVQEASRFMELDSRISADLKDIVNLAAQICGTPIAVISIIDEHIQWFKAAKGTGTDRNTREASFCKYTIEQDELLIVSDARLDHRFNNYPVVTGEPHIRFYAGANLTTRAGYNAGTLCVLDVEPKELSAEQQNALRVLSKQAMNLMELSWSLKALDEKHEETVKQKQVVEASEIQLKAFFNTSKDLFILLNCNMEVLAFNRSAENYIQKASGRQLTNGTRVTSYLDKLSNKVIIEEFRKALRGDSAVREWQMAPNTAHVAWMETHFMPVVRNEQIIGVAINAADITLRKLGEEQLRIKNEALQHIAIIQSHEIRRPVASLLGLINLIKIDHNQPGNQFPYFDMIEDAVDELDLKIRDIVSESEYTLNIKASLF